MRESIHGLVEHWVCKPQAWGSNPTQSLVMARRASDHNGACALLKNPAKQGNLTSPQIEINFAKATTVVKK